MEKVKSMNTNFDDLKNYRQSLIASSEECKKLGNGASMKYDLLKKELLKGPVQLLHTHKEGCSRMQCIYFVFVYFSIVRLLVYAVPKIFLAW